MIRKNVFRYLITAACLAASGLNAQKCKPDTTLKKPGYKPNAIPHAQVGIDYNEAISVLVVRDTSFSGFPAQIDSVKATAVLGLPTGYSYECQHPRCVFLWDTVRCVRIFGNTTNGGTYPIKIPVIGYAVVLGGKISRKDTIRNFTLVVDGGTNVQLIKGLVDWNLHPNPAAQELQIISKTWKSSEVWKIVNRNGQELAIGFTGENGIYKANISTIPAGVYLATDGTKSKIFIKQ